MTTASETQTPLRVHQKPKRFLTLHQVIERVGISRSTLFRMEAKGRFPHSYKVADSAVRWLESDIDEFMSACVAGRRWESTGKVRNLSR